MALLEGGRIYPNIRVFLENGGHQLDEFFLLPELTAPVYYSVLLESVLQELGQRHGLDGLELG